MFRFAAIAILFSLPFAGQAGHSGYVINGKIHIVFKDGKKIGKWPNEDRSRTPSAMYDLKSKDHRGQPALYFEEDELARCYFVRYVRGHGVPSGNPPLHCIRK